MNSNGAIDFSDLEDEQMWTAQRAPLAKPAQAKIDPAARLSLGAARSVATVARFPCSKCRGSGRFISWAGRDVGPCNQCRGTGKQKTDPNIARERAAKRVQSEMEKRNARAAAWREQFPHIAAWLQRNIDSFDFARSLSNALYQYGSLTDNQMAAVEKCIARDQERAKAAERKPDAEVGGAGFERMVLAFNAAAASGLRYPKFRVGDYAFSPASASSKNPGCLYVKRGLLYVGKITGAGAFFASRDATDEDKAEVARIGSDPLAAAVMHGKQTGQCSCCGRELTNQESVQLGIGPICRDKWGL